MLHYDALRTYFLAGSSNSEPKKHVIKGDMPSRVTRLSSTKESARADVQMVFDEIAKHEYSLSTGNTFRAKLVTHDKESYTLVLGFHNIAIDAFSIAHRMSDVSRAYQFETLTPNPILYLDFTRPIPEPLPFLPHAKVKIRRVQRSYGHNFTERVVGNELVQRIEAITQALGFTAMQFYLSALQVLLCRLLNIDDIYIGVVFNGRDLTSKFGDTVGHLADILPIRAKGALGKSFSDLLEDTTETLLDSLDHANIPSTAMLEEIRPDRSEGNMPLFQVAHNYRGVEKSRLNSIGNCTTTWKNCAKQPCMM
ncbi:hypothetical protein QQS21_007276 [Conoideocrella luteorostrata]|uniref:Condensation domain-containing protein n=1 Tax=Conoideocrella luteorostrata TaxID=1105319 RepID=A0AAJ0CLW1_9HYPO|nr:hypothetical protein QQS21_007276 [Conoideocrella luteorostrata]